MIAIIATAPVWAQGVVLYADRLEGEKRIPLVQQSLRLGSAPYLSPDGKTLATGDSAGNVRRWEIA